MERALDGLARQLGRLAGLLFLVLFGANLLNIGARYLFGLSYIWLPDLSRILFIWMVFLGGTAAFVWRQHLIIDLLKDRLPARVAGAAAVTIQLLLSSLFAVMIVKGARMTAVQMNIPYDSWEAVPTGVSYAAVPVAGAVMLVTAGWRLVAAVRGKPAGAGAGSEGAAGVPGDPTGAG